MTDFVTTSIGQVEYAIFSDSISFEVPDFEIVPAECHYNLEYTAIWRDGATDKPLPAFIQVDGSGKKFFVQSTNFEDVKPTPYQIVVTGSVPPTVNPNPYTEELIVELNVVNGCNTDHITPTSDIDSFDYYISFSGPVAVSPEYTQD